MQDDSGLHVPPLAHAAKKIFHIDQDEHEIARSLDIARKLIRAGVPIFTGKPDSRAQTGYRLPSRWQQTVPDLAAVDEWQPGMALCALMGVIVDGLDIDPRSGGQRIEPWPISYGHAATPSGGTHDLIAPLRTGSRDDIWPGVDLKSGKPDGSSRGFLFIAPTVRASKVDGTARPYRWLAVPQITVATTIDVSGTPVITRYAELTEPKREERPRVAATAPVDRDRGARVGRGALRTICAHLSQMDSGGRNRAAYDAACWLIECINAGWLDAQQAEDEWRNAVTDHPGGVHVPDREINAIWRSAGRTIGDKAAQLPAGNDPFLPEVWTGVVVPPFDAAAGVALPNFVDAGVPASLPPVNIGGLVAQSGIEPEVPTDPVEALIAETLTADELEQVPNPVPLILDILDLNTAAWLIGKSGSYKSFVALDWAAHVGTGLPWQGKPVRQGSVLYIVAEGAGGMKLRKRAWEKIYGPMKDVRFLPRPVQADERRGLGEWSILVAACRRLRPSLVIIDTQARVTVGIEENSNTDIGIYIEQANRIKAATGACVLTVHHIGRSGTDARGGSALDGAQDSEIRIERTDDFRITLHTDKQKDMADSGQFDLALTRVEGGRDADTGRDLSSLAVTAPGTPVITPEPEWRRDLTANQGQIVDVLIEHAADVGLTKAEIRRLIKDRFGDMPSASFHSAWTTLVSKQIMIHVAGSQRWVLASMADSYSG